jgi:hypothetical protein
MLRRLDRVFAANSTGRAGQALDRAVDRDAGQPVVEVVPLQPDQLPASHAGVDREM